MDADERDEWLAYFAEVCPKCGNLRSVCSNPDIDWHPQEDVCWVTATQEWGERRLREKHEKDKPEDPNEMHYLDGRTVWVSQFDLERSGVELDQEAQDPGEDEPRDQ